MRKTILKVAVLIAILICVYGVWVASRLSGPPKVSITLLGYTNDMTSGITSATFAVSNLNPSAVFVYMPSIEMPAPGKPGGLEFDSLAHGLRWRSVIKAGNSTVFTCPVPTNQTSWRVSFNASLETGPVWVFKDMVNLALTKIYITPVFNKHMPYGVHGDWIEKK